MTNQEEQGKKWSQLVARYRADEGFKQRLMAAPTTVLAAEGLELPAGVSVEVHEDTATVRHLVIPAPPAELSDEDLGRVAGGLTIVGSSYGTVTGKTSPAPAPSFTIAGGGR